MSRITVTLGTKTKQAESIVEPLLSSDAALVERGKSLLYHECVDRNIVNIDFALYATIPMPSDIMKVTEDNLGLEYSGVVTSFSVSVSNNSLSLQSTIERPIL